MIEKKTLRMALSIGKTASNHREEVVHLQLQDELSGVRFANAEIGLEDFARALLGQGCIPCTVEVRLSAPIGKRREHKREMVPIPSDLRCFREAPDYVGEDARTAVAPFEVDGWAAFMDDLFSSNKRTRDGDQVFASVSFERWVEAEDE